jgi:hypothetical protein
MGVAEAARGTKAISSLAQAGKAGEIAAKMLSKGAGGVVEGAFYGTGELLSEAALGDPNLTATNALTTFGLNTVLGGVAGGLAEGVSIAASKGWKETKKLLIDDWDIPSKVGEGYAKVLAKVKLLDKDKADEFVALFSKENKAGREQVIHYMDNPNEMSAALTKNVSQLTETGKFETQFLGDIREAARNSDLATKYAKGSNPATEISSTLDTMNSALKTIEKNPTKYSGGISQDLAAVRDELAAAAKGSKSLADLNGALLDARQQIDQRFKNLMSGAEISFEGKNAKELVMQMRGAIGEQLKDPKLFGEYAHKFRAADEAFSEYLTATKEYRKALMRKETVPGGATYVLDEAKLHNTLRSPDSPQNALRFGRIKKLEEATRKVSNVAATFADDPKLSQTVGDYTRGLLENIDGLKKIRSSQLLVQSLEKETGKALTGAIIGGAMGNTFSDMPGATVAGAGAGWFLGNPKSALRYLVKMERANKIVGDATDASVRKFLGFKVPEKFSAAWSQATAPARPLAVKEILQSLNHDDMGHDSDKLKSGIMPLQNPQNLDEHLIEALPRLDSVAPNTYAAMNNNIQAGMAFLATKAPQEIGFDLKSGNARVSDSEMRKFSLYANAVFNPATVFQELQKGMVRSETVETLKAVYPSLYAQLSQKAVELIAEPGSKDLSWEKKKQLSAMFDVPASPSLAMGAQLNASWASAPAPEEVQPTTSKPINSHQPSPSVALQMRRG